MHESFDRGREWPGFCKTSKTVESGRGSHFPIPSPNFCYRPKQYQKHLLWGRGGGGEEGAGVGNRRRGRDPCDPAPSGERRGGKRGGRGAGTQEEGKRPKWPSTHQSTIDWSDRAVGTTAKQLLLLGGRERGGGKWGQTRGRDYVTASVTPISGSVGKK